MIPVEKVHPTKKAWLVNWRVVFEYEDGSEKESYEVLDHRDEEHIDDTISSVIQDAGLWEDE